ncbi:MAG: hypothetical protein HZA25_00910, partial [Candidatus Niyogibacteria bacterium]|nr:hypothetical protein [Candidatus Niyogibacteria bacterium]
MRKLAFAIIALSLCAILLAPSVHAEETAEKRSAFEAQFEEVWQLILR